MIVSCKYELQQGGLYVLWGLTGAHAHVLGTGTQVSIVFDSGTFSMVAHGVKEVVDETMRERRAQWRAQGAPTMHLVQVTFPERWPVDEINEVMSARSQNELQPLLKRLLDRATTLALESPDESFRKDQARHALPALEGHHADVQVSEARVVKDEESTTTQSQGCCQAGPTEDA